MDVLVLISGRGSNMEALATALRAGRISGRVPVRITAVISNKPRAPGLAIARDLGIPTFVEESMEGLANRLEKCRADLICLAGFMRVLPREITDKYTIINIHPALLPMFPGLNAQEQAVKSGAKYSGCTVHFVDSGVDTGPIIVQDVVPVHPGDTPDTLAARILEREHVLYPSALSLIANGSVACKDVNC